jgi:hypothetical protein
MRVRLLIGSFVLFTLTLVLVSARPSAQGQDPASAKALYTLLTQGQRGGAPAGGGQAPKNLQVLPKDWTIPQVTTLMRTFTQGLGVQCTYCHVQDRSVDDNPHKGVARKMIAMMNATNDALKDVGEPAKEGSPKVTCYTCHRGQEKPLTVPPTSGGY